jgi:trk system potassium uptake protein TrkH
MTIARTICLGFVAVIAIGTLLLCLPFCSSEGNWTNPITALFTSTSAVCVTGLAVVDTGTYFSFWGQLVILLLVQVGGLGYMTTTTFLISLIGRKFNYRSRMAIQESFDRPFLLGSKSLVQSVIGVTLLFELTGILCLFPVFLEKFSPLASLWLATFHCVSAWNNAGFGLFKDNFMSYQSSWVVNLVIPLLIIFGGIGYQVIIEMYFWLNRRLHRSPEPAGFSLNFKVVTSTTSILLIGGTVLFLLLEFTNLDTIADLSFSEKIMAAWFQSVTTRTAGFNSIDNGKLTTASLLLTMGLMFIGASPSGTGGGIKTTTLRILTNCTRSVLRGNNDVIIYRREIPVSLVLKAVAVVFGSAVWVILTAFLIAFWEFGISYAMTETPFDIIQVLFEVISAFATVGLSTGITASLSSFSLILLVFTMLAGRVGVLVLMAAIIGDSSPRLIKFPEENLLVG